MEARRLNRQKLQELDSEYYQKLQVKNQFSKLKIYSTREGRPFANSIFNLAERYIGIFIVLTVMLSGLGMIILAKAYAAENILTIR